MALKWQSECEKTQTSALRVLIVDDNVDAAQLMGMLLEESGHDVRKVYDGLAALEVFAKYRPNVVLLDIGLPGIDGFEVATRMRENPDISGVVLIALTGYGRDTDKQRSLNAGFDYFLVKPTNFKKVLQIIASVSESVLPK